ncbi:NifU family protein [Halopelagius longus]|uniref:Fe-S cluster biogenesis protein NfuA, 4Fe-4S-binding domain n=1 Tax=Halopelagius longus TaxID=1236180 RepID=A0A1H1DY51_9EURY|nr:NifU family protein [Halopelagius longus]SDQ81280.1 Fe-S cluster biogenesis protein NfuA, 4Fe-4S-binding domain [Halopelagius longus]
MTDDGESGESLKERIETWMTGQMPIIQMHGGNSVVQKADPESGEVVVELGGACAGCGISDITADNIKSDLIMDFDEVTDVQVKVPSSGDHGSSTVEGGRGGELQYGNESPNHF